MVDLRSLFMLIETQNIAHCRFTLEEGDLIIGMMPSLLPPSTALVSMSAELLTPEQRFFDWSFSSQHCDYSYIWDGQEKKKECNQPKNKKDCGRHKIVNHDKKAVILWAGTSLKITKDQIRWRLRDWDVSCKISDFWGGTYRYTYTSLCFSTFCLNGKDLEWSHTDQDRS